MLMKNDDDDISKFMRMKELYSLNIKHLKWVSTFYKIVVKQ